MSKFLRKAHLPGQRGLAQKARQLGQGICWARGEPWTLSSCAKLIQVENPGGKKLWGFR